MRESIMPIKAVYAHHIAVRLLFQPDLKLSGTCFPNTFIEFGINRIISGQMNLDSAVVGVG